MSEPLESPQCRPPVGQDRPSSDDTIDAETFARLNEFIGTDPAVLHQVVSSFVAESHHLVTRVQSALSEEDDQRLIYAIHTLKSGSAMFGALHLSAICTNIEYLVQRQQTNAIADAVDRLLAESHMVALCLERLISHPPDSAV